MALALRDTGLDYIAGGRRYPIYHGAGVPYIYDPQHRLKAERADVVRFLQSKRRPGLGTTTDTAVQAVATAANFIPGVGPIISAVLNIGDALFGGGDPTALSILINQVVQLRAQIADANNALGNTDSFTIPAGFNAQDKDTWRDFVDGIVEQTLTVTEAQIQSNRRPDFYSAIAALQKYLAQLTQQVHDQEIAGLVRSELQPAPPAAAGAGGATTPDQAGTPAGDGVTAGGLTISPTVALVLGLGAAIVLARR